MKLEPGYCNNCDKALYTSDTDEIQFTGGEYGIVPLAAFISTESTNVEPLFDRLKRFRRSCLNELK